MKAICKGCRTREFYPKGCPLDPVRCEQLDEDERQHEAEVDAKAEREAENDRSS